MFDKINNKIITTLGIDKLPVDKQKEIMEKWGKIVYQEIMISALDAMNEEGREAFNKLVEGNPSPETIFDYLSEKVPDLDTIVFEEADDIRIEMEGELDKMSK